MRFPSWNPAPGIVFLILLLHALASPAAARPHYHITASVGLTAPQVRGTVRVDVVNDSRTAVDDVVLVLFANRFAHPDTQVNDVNRPFVYPREEFHPGGMTLRNAQVDGAPAEVTLIGGGSLPEGCAARVALQAPLAPGAETTVTVEFETIIPERFGSFGIFERMLTATGGWYPSAAWLQPDGTWAVDSLPPIADFEVELSVDPKLSVLLNGQLFQGPAPQVRTAVREVSYLSLVAAPDLRRAETEAGGIRIVFFYRPPRFAHRIAFGPDALEIMLETLREVIEARPPEVPLSTHQLVVVAVPLRWYMSVPGEGMVLISDRALKVFPILRPFHERELAQGVYTELLRPRVAARESPRDYGWVREALSHNMAWRLLKTTQPEARSTQDWIELFNVFAVVDRFETAPKVPFSDALFPDVPEADALHERVDSFNNDWPPGHVILGKLRNRLGDAEFQRVVDQCIDAPTPLRECTASASGHDLSAFYDEWLQPYPLIHYTLADIHRNERYGEEFSSRFSVVRVSSRPISEPVDVQVRSIGGKSMLLRWNGDGDRGQLSAITPWRVFQIQIDPERRLLQSTRADNASPPSTQIVFDSAEVEVSSTEFGFSALVVGRARYDYRKDLGLLAFYTNRSVGVGFGPRLHWGERNDANSYRHNLFAFYGVQGLDASFQDDQRPSVRTAGHTNGLGLRYDYNTILSYNNPTQSVRARGFVDWFDGALGSDYDYVDWGASLSATHPFWTARTVLAGEILNGFSEPLGSSVVPNQGLFSLGGARSIRGIGAEEELGRNIFLVRAEVRQAIYPELEANAMDVLVVRRTQLRFFVDTGQVSNSAGAIYDPSGYAVGVGAGLNAVVDVFGFFPLMTYLELATQARGPGDAGDVQVLFGTRQPF